MNVVVTLVDTSDNKRADNSNSSSKKLVTQRFSAARRGAGGDKSDGQMPPDPIRYD